MSGRASVDRTVYRASTTAPVNMAVIKYWGKRDAALNLPTNSSISVTLSQRDLRTHTTASCSNSYPPGDTLTLNGAAQDISSPRTQACLSELRRLRAELERSNPHLPPLSTFPLRILSINNFPTAAGLASSAAGFAALVRALADLYQLPHSATELSRIARQGSGSACRSLHGGIVAWDMGSLADGSDSVARPVAPPSHWPTLRALVLVISAAAKEIPSTRGMQTTVATSALFAARARDVVPQRMAQMAEAVAQRDFSSFALLAMRDSNSLHAVCLDAWPPVCYLTDASRAAMRVVDELNRAAAETVAAYTFDAGPNCVVFYEEAHAGRVEAAFRGIVGHVEGWDGGPAGRKADAQTGGAVVNAVSPEGRAALSIDERTSSTLRDGVSRVILTGIGEAPVGGVEHLLDENGDAKAGTL